MEVNKASVTALVTSLIRAHHTRTAPTPIIDDPWGDRLVPESVRDGIYHRALAESGSSESTQPERQATIDAALRSNAAYTAVVIRTRYAEDALHSAVESGAKQYVLIGTGFDSYALRVPKKANHLAIFEVDHPATQNLKQSRLRECHADTHPHLHFVAADLASETLAGALAKTSFDRRAKSFFSWLGVSMYLSRRANMNLLRSVATCGGPGSELVFTYFDQSYFEPGARPSSEASARLRARVAAAGEPFLSGFHPHELKNDLREVGLELLEDCAGGELVRRYDPEQRYGFTASGHSRVAWVRVM